jgi:hypothetical protein
VLEGELVFEGSNKPRQQPRKLAEKVLHNLNIAFPAHQLVAPNCALQWMNVPRRNEWVQVLNHEDVELRCYTPSQAFYEPLHSSPKYKALFDIPVAPDDVEIYSGVSSSMMVLESKGQCWKIQKGSRVFVPRGRILRGDPPLEWRVETVSEYSSYHQRSMACLVRVHEDDALEQGVGHGRDREYYDLEHIAFNVPLHPDLHTHLLVTDKKRKREEA